MRTFLFAREFGIKPEELDQMKLSDIEVLEYGLEEQAKAMANDEPDASMDPEAGGSLADERAREIRKYEQEQQAQRRNQTSAETLASLGVTVESNR